jgi:hypothetical protein
MHPAPQDKAKPERAKQLLFKAEQIFSRILAKNGEKSNL